MNTPKTLFDKIWGDHVISQTNKNQYLLYIDRHLVHEVTSPQAFEGLKLNKRKVRKPELTLGVADHNVPTTFRDQGINSINCLLYTSDAADDSTLCRSRWSPYH